MSAPIASEAPAAVARLAVAEIFGPTFQGEGPSMGRRCSFLRLSGCNLRCTWCDTKYTWDWSSYDPSVERALLSVDDVLGQITAQGTDMLVVSGGEPLLQQRRLLPLLRRLGGSMRVEVETAGTVAPLAELVPLVAQFNVSPKLSSSGNPVARRHRTPALEALRDTGRAAWKFVACSTDDLDEIEELVQRYGLEPVYVMPEGTSAEVITERLRELAPSVLARGWNLSTRLHVLLYGNRRGV